MQNYYELLLKKITDERKKRELILRKGDRTQNPDLKDLSEVMDIFFIYNKLKIYCEYLSNTSFIHDDKKSVDISEIRYLSLLDQLETSIPLPEYPVIQIYYYIKILFENISNNLFDNQQYILKIEEILDQEMNCLAEGDQIEVCSYITNYCIRRSNYGDKKLLRTLFLFYNRIINLRYAKEKNKRQKIQPGFFKNAVVAAIKLAQNPLFASLQTTHLVPIQLNQGFQNGYEWAEAFTQYYSQVLAKDKNTYKNYCLALIAFKQENFTKALKIIKQNKNNRAAFINLDSKVLHLKTAFEIFKSDPSILRTYNTDINRLIDSYRKLLTYEGNQKKTIGYQYEIYHHFYLTYNKLYKLFMNYNNLKYKGSKYDTDKSTLISQINISNSPYNQWLISQINQIK